LNTNTIEAKIAVLQLMSIENDVSLSAAAVINGRQHEAVMFSSDEHGEST